MKIPVKKYFESCNFCQLFLPCKKVLFSESKLKIYIYISMKSSLFHLLPYINYSLLNNKYTHKKGSKDR